MSLDSKDSGFEILQNWARGQHRKGFFQSSHLCAVRITLFVQVFEGQVLSVVACCYYAIFFASLADRC